MRYGKLLTGISTTWSSLHRISREHSLHLRFSSLFEGLLFLFGHMDHVFSIDVEDWYQGIEIPMDQWDGFERRIDTSMGRLLDLMARYDITATCFVLGKVAEEHPDLVRRIHKAGHEVATHGYSHEKIYNLSPGRFRDELRRSIELVQDLTGEPVLGHRAPYFTITEESLWALDILRDEGILYDSSIHPVFNYRYGIPNADRQPSLIESEKGEQMMEVPVAGGRIYASIRIGSSGGSSKRLKSAASTSVSTCIRGRWTLGTRRSICRFG